MPDDPMQPPGHEPRMANPLARRAWDSFKRWPWWGQSLGIAVVVIVLVGALSLVSGSDSPRGAANAIGGVDGTGDATRIAGGGGQADTLTREPPDVVGVLLMR